MTNTITVPTTLTKEEYQTAFFAIDTETADHFIIWNSNNGEENNLWVGRDFNSLKNYEGFKIAEVWVTDENGCGMHINAHIVPTLLNILQKRALCQTGQSFNDLDLDALANGRIEWV